MYTPWIIEEIDFPRINEKELPQNILNTENTFLLNTEEKISRNIRGDTFSSNMTHPLQIYNKNIPAENLEGNISLDFEGKQT